MTTKKSLAFSYTMGDERLSDVAVLPEGWYKGALTDFDTKESEKAGTGGGYVDFTVTVLEGAHKGSVLFESLFLWADEDENPKLVQMTRRKMNSILEAIERPEISDLGDMLNIPMYFRVSTQEGREVEDENTGEMKKYKARSQIKNYKTVAQGEALAAEQSAEVPAAPAKAPAKTTTKAPVKAPVKSAQKEEAAEETTETNDAADDKPAAKAGGTTPPWLKK